MEEQVVWEARAMKRLMKRATASAFAVALCAGIGAPLAAEGKARARQSYRFVLEADGGGKVAFSGLIAVDGKDRLIERGETPYEFGCEAGSTIAGYFEVVKPGSLLRLKVMDPAYSSRRAAATAVRFDRVRFAWAQPEVGPRCVDSGRGGCPDTVPSADELKRRLELLRKTAEPGNPS